MAAHRHNRLHRAKREKRKRRHINGANSLTGQERLPAHAGASLFLQRTIGNQALINLIQRQQEEEGSLTVVGSASETEGATDEGSLTTEITEQRGQDKTPTEEEMGETLTKESREALRVKRKNNEFHTQHPSFAQLGIRPKEIKGKKLASYIGNWKYLAEEWPDLPGAKQDSRRMKSAMEGYGYETFTHARNRTAPEVESMFGNIISKAGAGDAVFVYYAGHGIPGGIAGVESKVQGPAAKEEGGEGGERGVKLVKGVEGEARDEPMTPYTSSYLGHTMTDIAQYSSLMAPLEAGASKGVHTTFISDACHSGTATDLVRDKAVEKLAKDGENKRVKAVTGQINRLKDMKAQIPVESAVSQPEEERGFKEGDKPVTLEQDQRPAAQTYWEDVVHPELELVGAYLKEAGFDMSVPEKPGTYTKEGIAQQINAFINQLVDLGEAIEKEKAESPLAIAP
ncbi:MAG: caspase family protein [Chloroflexota bacterium]